jgi:hypothetical protein
MNVRPAWPRPPLGVRGGSPPPPEPPKAPEAVEPGVKSTEAMMEPHGKQEEIGMRKLQDEENKVEVEGYASLYA